MRFIKKMSVLGLSGINKEEAAAKIIITYVFLAGESRLAIIISKFAHNGNSNGKRQVKFGMIILHSGVSIVRVRER